MHSHTDMSHKHSFHRDCTYQPTTEPDFAVNYKTFNTKLYLYIYNSYTCPTCDFQKIKATHCTDTLNSQLQATFLDGISPPIKLTAYFMYMKATLQKDSQVSQICISFQGRVTNLKRQDKCTPQNYLLSSKSCHVTSVTFLIHAFM